MFIPLRDENPSGKFPFVNVALLLANLGVFVYEVTLVPRQYDLLVTKWGFIPLRITALLHGHGSIEAALLPLVTSMFLHTGFAHILGNTLFLWIFGDNVEAEFGHLRYLLFYLFCGVGAGLAHYAFNTHSHIPAVGASGAISGIMGAYIVLEPRNRVLTLILIFVVRVPAVIVLGVWFALQFLSALAAQHQPAVQMNGGVAVWAHIGGFLLGALVALAAKKR